MKKPFIVFFLVFVSCRSNVNTKIAVEDSGKTFQNLLDEAVGGSFDEVPGVAMTVLAPDLNIAWSGASGFNSKNQKDSLTVHQPFRIASVTKTFVAASILRLHEEGMLSVYDPISKHVSEEHVALLRGGGYQPDSITLLQVLSHTNGMYDYALGGRSYLETIFNDPKKVWTRTDQLKLAIETGKPVGYPGEKYSYNDTGYILAGETIERLSDSTLAFGLRTLLGFERLKLKHTWLEAIEKHPLDTIKKVSRYAGKYDLTEAHPSIDLYGGGGLVSTTGDIASFIQALFNGEVFAKEKTLKLLLASVPYAESYDPLLDERYKDYRLGLWELDIYGLTAYMHDGFWGTSFIHVPKYNCTVAVNYTSGYGYRLIKKTILTLKNMYEINNA